MTASYLSHLESPMDGSRHRADLLQGMHAGRPLLTRYELDRLKAEFDRDRWNARSPEVGGMWRYRELLPVQEDCNVVSLGEGQSPLLPCKRLGAELGLNELFIKDESLLPTGSFKSRGLGMAISRAKELGVKRVALPTAGNAGGAMAAYAARAGLEAYVFMPRDTPAVNRYEAVRYGARAFVVDGLINDCGKLVHAGQEAMGWFDLSTLKEPYRLEGKKTMGLELAQQLDWRLPGTILYPTGGGTGLIGMWKAFAELEALGWLNSNNKPRMVACQSDGCAPIVRAFEAGEKHATLFEGAETVASGLRVPAAVGDFLILDAVRESHGVAMSAAEGQLLDAMQRVMSLEGIALCPEAAACVLVLEELARAGWVQPDEQIVLFNTGAAQKYVEALEVPLAEVPRVSGPESEPDWDQVASGR